MVAPQNSTFRNPKCMKSPKRRSAALRNRTQPAFIEPMRCKPVTALPAGERWAFELKLDGYRCIAVKHGKEVTLFSRHRKVLNRRFPRVVDALASLRDEFVLDGELVVLDPEGRPSFQLLQGATSGSLPTYFYVFDVLHKNGELWWIVPFRSAEPRWKASWPSVR